MMIPILLMRNRMNFAMYLNSRTKDCKSWIMSALGRRDLDLQRERERL